jgi:hypothetical protein
MDTVMVRSGRVVPILGTAVYDSSGKLTGYTGVTENGAGSAYYKDSPWATFQAYLTTTSGNGSGTITIETSNDGTHWNTTVLGTITLSNVASGAGDGFASLASPWKFIRAKLASIAGTGTSVVVLMGV